MHRERVEVIHAEENTPSQPRRSGYVYFIQCELTKLVKIGFSESYPTKRMRGLQTGSGGKLHLIAFIKTTFDREGELHRRFAEQHERGEWFRLEGDLADWLMELDA
ncbi:GIY-YIG nuclease family protein [Sphingorhabdus sp. SMR4y]|uniref:GIY-YIG nuclease family protein n=1 Tax=Sphingorhabdus sp. SMR4y TaxID=2584094 RepID=UPI000B5F331E|nr:GIY-YIG nuclease family protein [Sphingorhabdus sp. SMR4y]ASK88483.1 meiotically up-regulated gene 113 [Sphingorhabdus sp. SMR4y]